jgi:hypothetical protein
MGLFFGLTVFLTYYSKVVYLRNLPAVAAAMPERTGEMKNGRYTYIVPETAIHMDIMRKTYVLTARYQADIMGERHLAVRVDVWVLERRKDGTALVDGIVREEPVLTDTGDRISAGAAVKLEKEV